MQFNLATDDRCRIDAPPVSTHFTHSATSLRGGAQQREVHMHTEARVANVASSTYLVAVLAVVGVFAAMTAVLIAWPALAYIGAKLF